MLSEPEHELWPFSSWLKLAVCRFGLSPDVFWNMSVHDWFVLNRSTQNRSLTRTQFDALYRAFPDDQSEDNYAI